MVDGKYGDNGKDDGKICVSVCVCVCACVRAYVHPCVQACVRAFVRACVCVYRLSFPCASRPNIQTLRMIAGHVIASLSQLTQVIPVGAAANRQSFFCDIAIRPSFQR